jgi:hypothetical protein
MSSSLATAMILVVVADQEGRTFSDPATYYRFALRSIATN